MTAGVPSGSAGPNGNAPHSHNHVSREYFNHSSAKRINTDAFVVDKIRAEYPELHLTVVPQYNCNIAAWAASGRAGLAPIDNEKDRLRWRNYIPPATRLGGPQGVLSDYVSFGKFLLDWQGKSYILYIVDGRDGTVMELTNQYILSPSVESTNKLLVEAGIWNNELHDEIWVFDQGFWSKSIDLYDSIRDASWDDVILEKSIKDAIINDVQNFFDSRNTFEKLRVPWKRGIIYHGPPGNGKTISIKAMMSTLYKRKEPIPTASTLSSFPVLLLALIYYSSMSRL